ncbi:MAG: TRAP transporter substrate-binding protein DctP [Pseudomonadota bacterium]
MRRRGLAAALAAGVLVSGPVLAEDMTMVSGFPENFVFTREIALPFIEKVQAATGGEVAITLQGPDVVPGFEQYEPVQAGVFDLLFTHPAYHAGSTALGLAIDAVKADPTARREAGVFAQLDAHYQEQGLKLISAPPTGSDGFHYVLKEPITAEPAFAGRKIRGTVSYHPMIEALGGSPVVMGGGEAYSALQTGVIDGAAWGLSGVKDFKWYEVAGYVTRPVFGQVGLMIFMNLDRWESLDPALQETILKAGEQLELDSVERFNALAEQELKDLKALGMQETRFSPDEALALDRLWAEGVWAVSTDKAGAEAEALRATAKKAGLTP